MTKKINHSTQWLLVANGSGLSQHKLQQLAKGKHVLVLDGAYQVLYQASVMPDVLLGDFDSIHPDDLAYARSTSIQIIEAFDQSKSDLEKGIDYLDQQNASDICIVSGTGKRLQHTLHNLYVLKKYYQAQRPLTLVSETEVICYYHDKEIALTGEIKDSVGLFGFPYAVVSSVGLKYEMNNYILNFEKATSLSNELASKQVALKISGDLLLIHEKTNETLLK